MFLLAHTISDNSTQTIFSTISNFNSFDIEITDEWLDSKPSPTNFSQPSFQSIKTPVRDEPYLSPLHTLTLSFTIRHSPFLQVCPTFLF